MFYPARVVLQLDLPSLMKPSTQRRWTGRIGTNLGRSSNTSAASRSIYETAPALDQPTRPSQLR